jgi:hypothetical protein
MIPVIAPGTAEARGFGGQDRHATPSEVRQAAIDRRAALLPKSARRNYLRATAGKASPRSAIKAFCGECCGDVRSEVTNCTALTCPLFAYRPFQKKRGSL